MSKTPPIKLSLDKLGIEIIFNGRDRVIAKDLTDLAAALTMAAEQAVVAYNRPAVSQGSTDQEERESSDQKPD